MKRRKTCHQKEIVLLQKLNKEWLLTNEDLFNIQVISSP